MKAKYFALIAIVAIFSIGSIVFEHVTSAQLRDRVGQGVRDGQLLEQGLTMFVDNAWIDLSFVIQVDDDTLKTLRPIHQKARDDIETKMKAARASEKRPDLKEMMVSVQKERDAFDTSLAKVLTEKQMTTLKQLREKRRADAEKRRTQAQERRGSRGIRR